MAERLKGVGIALAILVVVFPLSAMLTILSSPLWRWFETQTGIAAYGHSGPAEWCYLATYVALLVISTAFWARIRSSRIKRHDNQAAT